MAHPRDFSPGKTFIQFVNRKTLCVTEVSGDERTGEPPELSNYKRMRLIPENGRNIT